MVPGYHKPISVPRRNRSKESDSCQALPCRRLNRCHLGQWFDKWGRNFFIIIYSFIYFFFFCKETKLGAAKVLPEFNLCALNFSDSPHAEHQSSTAKIFLPHWEKFWGCESFSHLSRSLQHRKLSSLSFLCIKEVFKIIYEMKPCAA